MYKSEKPSLDDILRSIIRAIQHCWKHFQHPETACCSAPWSHCPLYHATSFVTKSSVTQFSNTTFVTQSNEGLVSQSSAGICLSLMLFVCPGPRKNLEMLELESKGARMGSNREELERMERLLGDPEPHSKWWLRRGCNRRRHKWTRWAT